VTRFDEIDDVDTLRQVAKLQAQEIAALHTRIGQLVREVSQLRGKPVDRQLTLELEQLQQRLAVLQRQVFAPSSEKRPKPASSVTERHEEQAAQQRGHGPREQPSLPVIDRAHELGPDERKCPVCTGTLGEMSGQAEESEEITVVERHFVLVRHRRQKYRCKCNGAVVTAPMPPRLIPGGRYSLEFAVDVAVAKYLDHMPLERQVRVMQREGLTIDSQTLWDQIQALARHLEQTYRALGERTRRAEVVHADETWWRLMDRSSSKKWWAWCLATDDAVFYRISESRSAEAAKQIVGDFKGVIVCDGYGAYESLSRAGPGLMLAHCWAHVRRKFVEIENFYPVEAGEILDLIGRLYAVDGVARLRPDLPDADRATALEIRRRLLQSEAQPIVDEIRQWAFEQRAARESGLRKAIEYMLGLWPGLVRFLDDPRVPLDNNQVERALRGAVIGRKNHYGSRSRRGTEVAALFYSLLESAKASGIDEQTYLLRAAHTALANPSLTLLPHDLRL
jgi:transposase